jgi:hypothetical protein
VSKDEFKRYHDFLSTVAIPKILSEGVSEGAFDREKIK